MDKRVLLSVVLVLAAGAVLALYMMREPQRQALAAERQQREAVERGSGLYATLCSRCHGPSGEGSVGPALARDKYLERNRLSADSADDLRKAAADMGKTIARGRFNTTMPAWDENEGGPLNREQIQELTTFLLRATAEDWERAAAEANAAAPVRDATAPAGGTPVETEAGKQLYVSQGCAACHGPGGEGGLGPALPGHTAEQIVAQVRQPKGAMPAYPASRLSDEDLRGIVRFIESLKPEVGVSPAARPGAGPDASAALSTSAKPSPSVTPSPSVGPGLALSPSVTPSPSPASGASPAPSPATSPAVSPSVAETPGEVEAGRKLYTDRGCAACHGVRGEGGVGPPLPGYTEEQILAQVRKPRGMMPAYPAGQLNDDDLRRIVGFIQILKPAGQ